MCVCGCVCVCMHMCVLARVGGRYVQAVVGATHATLLLCMCAGPGSIRLVRVRVGVD